MITKTKSSEWFGTDYTMNIYRGCNHGCIYCDSRSDCYGIDNFDTVRAKEHAPELVKDNLKRRRNTGVVGTGSMSDPYNPFEKKHRLTRQALEYLDRYQFGVAIATKSDLITRDIDVLQRIQEHSPVIVKVTITTVDDELCRKIEPHVAVSSRRFAAIKQMADHGIFAGILMMPVLPFLEDNAENIQGIITRAAEHGARFIYPAFGMTLRNNQRDWYYDKLDEKFPGLKYKYIQQYGNSYECSSPRAKELWKLFSSECDRLGILYRMQDIIDAYKQGYGDRQLTLF
ncbi:radical SAM protein [Paenibacillus marinisediminis]